MLRPFISSISVEAAAKIETELARIEREEEITYLFAIESGSRAWGFPSPDSDYDVRFVYARKPEWYLRLRPGRDVIEMPISDELDLGGWDIQKTLNLMMKPNPVALEWINSPIRYRWDQRAADLIREFSMKITHNVACHYHYGATLRRIYLSELGIGDEVKVKKYFYALRPAFALMWMAQNNSAPPMNLQDLAAGIELTATEIEVLDHLISRKSKTDEKGVGARVPELDRLLARGIQLSEKVPERPVDQIRLMPEANALFHKLIKFTG